MLWGPDGRAFQLGLEGCVGIFWGERGGQRAAYREKSWRSERAQLFKRVTEAGGWEVRLGAQSLGSDPGCPTWGGAARPDAGAFWGADRGNCVGEDGLLSFWEVAAGVGTERIERWTPVGAGDLGVNTFKLR